MNDKREALRSMLNNFINDKPEEASLDLHNYLAAKMKDVTGLNQAVTTDTVDLNDDAGDETDPE